MATGKPKSGAGPYAGYKKNYAPIKSSKGTKAEKVVGKVLAAAGGGVKPQKVKVGGKTMTTKPVEAGLGGKGIMLKAIARTAARNEGRSPKGLTPKQVAKTRESNRMGAAELREWYNARRPPLSKKDQAVQDKKDSARGTIGDIRSGSAARKKAKDKAAGAQGTKYAVKESSKGSRDSIIATKHKRVSPTSNQVSSRVRPYSQPLIGMTGKAPVKGRTSRPKGKK